MAISLQLFRMWILALFLASCWLQDASCTPVLSMPASSLPPVTLRHSVVMDQYNKFLFRWTPLDDRMLIQLEVRTPGYAGLGFSSNGRMKNSDIALGWVDPVGIVHLTDRYAHGTRTPSIDHSQDLTLLGGYQNRTHTVLRFSRPWVTCDVTQDTPLTDDTIRVIWAFDSADPDPESDRIRRHDHRGARSLYLKQPDRLPTPTGAHVRHWDVRSRVDLPPDIRTLYWCRLFKIPPLRRKNHVIGFEPLIEESSRPHVHHLLLYECHLERSAFHFEQWIGTGGAQCYSSNMPLSWSACSTPLVAWAVGAQGEMFPDHVGFPIGEQHGGATYFLLEIHYDNPLLKPGIQDSSGLRVFYTERLRKYEAGLLTLGHKVEPTQIIPPQRATWTAVSHCTSDCTKYMIPETGIKVFSGLLHSHLLGKSIVLRQIRNGVELSPIFQDFNYDFNYQESRLLPKERLVLPGDHLITTCNYDSSGRSGPTFGGFSTEEEMCLVFLNYFPKLDFSECYSRPDLALLFYTFGVRDLQNNDGIMKALSGGGFAPEYVDEEEESIRLKNMKNGLSDPSQANDVFMADFYHSVNISAPDNLSGMSFYALLHNETIWRNEALMKTLQDNVHTGQYEPTCLHNGRRPTVGLPKKAKYPKFNPFHFPIEKCSPGLPMSQAARGEPSIPASTPQGRVKQSYGHIDDVPTLQDVDYNSVVRTTPLSLEQLNEDPRQTHSLFRGKSRANRLSGQLCLPLAFFLFYNLG